MIKKSKIFGANARDLLYSGIVATISAILTEVHRLLTADPVVFNWITLKPALYVGLTAGISYFIKNVFSNSKGQFARSESAAGPGGGSNPPVGTEGLPK